MSPESVALYGLLYFCFKPISFTKSLNIYIDLFTGDCTEVGEYFYYVTHVDMGGGIRLRAFKYDTVMLIW